MATRYQNMTPEQKKKAWARGRRWQLKNREIVAARKNRHYHANRDKYLAIERERSWRKKYGLTVERYNEMLAAQGGACAICKSTKAGSKGQMFAVDHCHDSGRVRGLLCIACNSRLGFVPWYNRFNEEIAAYLRGAMS